jgi:hypothetical protein
MNGDTSLHLSARRDGTAFGLKLLTMVNAALYFLAALLHLGVQIPLGFVTLSVPEPIPPATVVETLIGAGLAAAAVAQFAHAGREPQLTWAAYVFALIGTVFGLTVALLRGLQGLDIGIHVVMLAGLAGGFIILWTAHRNRSAVRGGPAPPSRPRW